MKNFSDYLDNVIESGSTTKGQLQPARLSFFVSAWWHLQDPEEWPIFYVSARRVFERERLLVRSSDPVSAYFLFRQTFLSTAQRLSLSGWELEHLLVWLDEKKPEPPPPPPPPPPEDVSHTQVQWILGSLGRDLSCRVWIANNDHSKTWNGELLGSLSVAQFPNLGLGVASQKIISLIDVVWLQSFNQIAAAFEIEHSTSVYSGLLRMSDLVAASPNLLFPIYIVVPRKRIEKVRRELRRPTFQTLELHRRCGFFAYEDLIREVDSIRRWSSDPSVLEQLAERVADVEGEPD